MQKHVNLVDLVKSFPTNIYLQNLASIQKRTSPVKFAHLAEKSGKGSISNLSTKVTAAAAPSDGERLLDAPVPRWRLPPDLHATLRASGRVEYGSAGGRRAYLSSPRKLLLPSTADVPPVEATRVRDDPDPRSVRHVRARKHWKLEPARQWAEQHAA